MTFLLPWAPYFGNGCASVETCCPGHLRSSNPSKCGLRGTNLPTPVRQWGPSVQPVVFDPSSVRSNVGKICKLSRISYTCASMKLCCVGPPEIQVDAMQAIPRARENQSLFPVITWLNRSLAPLHSLTVRQYSLEVRNIESQRKGDEASSCQVRSRRRVTNKSRSIPLHLVYAKSSRVNNVLQLQFRRLRSKASRRGRCYPTPSFASNFHAMTLQPPVSGTNIHLVMPQEYRSRANVHLHYMLYCCSWVRGNHS